jgi:hypothetical protein
MVCNNNDDENISGETCVFFKKSNIYLYIKQDYNLSCNPSKFISYRALSVGDGVGTSVGLLVGLSDGSSVG